MNIKNIIKDLSYTGYTKEIIRHEAIRIIEEQNKEISRLNNIIDEIEKFTKDRIEYCYGSDSSLDEFNVYNEYDELISELKEGK